MNWRLSVLSIWFRLGVDLQLIIAFVGLLVYNTPQLDALL